MVVGYVAIGGDEHVSSTVLKSSTNSRRSFVTFAARYPDVIVLAAAFPVFALAGWPLLGYATAAALWLVQTVVYIKLEQKVSASSNPRQIVGLMTGGAMARAWFSAIGVLIVGILTDDATGLAAVVLVMLLFTVYFANKVFSHMLAQFPTDEGGAAP